MEILDQNGYRVVQLNDGTKLTDAIDLINRRRADGINLNFICNFPKDVDLLSSAEGIKSITINDYSWDFDYSIIHSLTTLECLSVYTTDKNEIDYSKFPNLKSTALFWRPRAESLFNCKSLEQLFLGKFSDMNLSRISGLRNLKHLRLNTGTVQNLHGIENLVNLEELLLMQVTKLQSIQGVESLPNLRSLHIDNCKSIVDIYKVTQLQGKPDVQIYGTTPTP